jgi:thiamine-phosphate pyrophosphorylase
MNQKLNGLYVITDNKLTPLDTIVDSVTKALTGGAKIVQLRDKISDDTTIEKTALKLQALCREFGALFVLNDKIDIAIKLSLDGLHIGRSDHANFDEIRADFKGILGISCYGDIELAYNFEHRGADYVAFGSFFSSPTKPMASVVNLSVLRDARVKLSIPICAIGGINKSNLDSVMEHKPDMICVISDIWNSDDIALSATQYAHAFK